MVPISAKKGQGVDGLLETVRCSSHHCFCSVAAAATAETHPVAVLGCLTTTCSSTLYRNGACPLTLRIAISQSSMQVLLVAELEELQANPARAARGTVLVRWSAVLKSAAFTGVGGRGHGSRPSGRFAWGTPVWLVCRIPTLLVAPFPHKPAGGEP